VVKVYLASPYGFAESTKPFLKYLINELREAGHKVVDPWEEGEKYLKDLRDREDMSLSEKKVTNEKLAGMNHKAISHKDIDIVVACLDGPDVDSGTASEVGYAYAIGKKIIGYRGDLRRTGENEAVRVNMQVQYWIDQSNGRIVKTVKQLKDALDEPLEQSRLQERSVRNLQSEKGS
jgi:nucleoside 2-deoxyribosyltransferase